MAHSELVTLGTDGLIMSADALSPIGIESRSQVWAKWIGASPDHDGPAHMVFSAIPFAKWPCTLRIECRVHAVAGALARCFRAVSDIDLNLMSARTTPSGYKSYHCVLIAEDSSKPLQDAMSSFRRSLKDRNLHGSKREPLRSAEYHVSDRRSGIAALS